MSRTAGFFDQWYTKMGRSGLRDQIARRALGLPPDMDVSGLLPWAGVAEVAAALNLAPGQLLVDLGCGRGGYGLEIARQTGARLLGLDFSPVAVTAAANRAASADIAGPAAFCVGTMTAAGVGAGAADAVVCIDTIMFTDAPLDALRECRRILAAGGGLVLTSWEATNLADKRLPQWARRLDLTRDLARAGFEQVAVTDKPAWREAERNLWESAIQADATGDPAIESLQEEARDALDLFDSSRRVCATATAPG
ncbi:MAG: class I SAM-dependent methyltransferase [Streptosporangiaceae bacterium]